ncbi:VCBS repeat-containing protein [Pelagicoccus sp. SDUM812002]|uniref:FG-GAP repeat domain-containing protein n=1 Tax=Pelagicoccus sp. SDUM812002 TaxID=3041266 RepID=UPI00280D7AA9|nr:VCBS repeat-containing protein [Pelagicoccus sp. SDUM812002]MDQ8187928.1 VCBS repeat-containing protein [Pelagicoccus sp. SDUM812002]
MKPLLILVAVASAFLASASDFPGWQGLRVIKSDNGAYKMLPIRESKDGAYSLLVVETRQSRLDFYRYVGRGETLDLSNVENPNYLPMAEDFEKVEVPLSRLPQVASVYDVDADGVDEIFLVQTDPRKLIVLKKKGSGEWEPIKEWEIADSELSTHQPVIVRPLKKGPQILISMSDGIQMIDYNTPEEVEWMQPRERDIERNRWWFLDLDGDDDLDVIEARNTVTAPIRWYEAEGERFRPAVSISEEITNTNVARTLMTSSGPKIAFLGANQANTISFYELGLGDESQFGKRNLLPLSQPDSGGWAAIDLEGRESIVELGRTKPILNVYYERDGFWSFSKSYPVLQDIKKVKSVGDKAKTLLFEVEDEGQIYQSRWDGARFTFPKRLGDSGVEVGDWKLLSFDQFGPDTWWVTQRGKSLVLSIWNNKEKEPRELEFAGLEGDYENAVWLGEERLLVKKKFSKTTSFCTLGEDGQAMLVTSRFKGSEIGRIRLHDETLYLAEGGVVQKLDENLEVIDQIMLDGDYSIRSFAPVSKREAYALETDGEHIHHLKMDKSGIFQTEDREMVPYSTSISMDPVLGLTLISANAINVPSPGKSRQLVLSSAVDPNEQAGRDYEKKTLGTLFEVDIDGDGIDEIATVDYGQRDIIVYGESGDGYEEVISWKVYDDGKYPYGQDGGNRNSVNPYRMIAADLDGDSIQDLVLASHDRILIYLARDSKL